MKLNLVILALLGFIVLGNTQYYSDELNETRPLSFRDSEDESLPLANSNEDFVEAEESSSKSDELELALEKQNQQSGKPPVRLLDCNTPSVQKELSKGKKIICRRTGNDAGKENKQEKCKNGEKLVCKNVRGINPKKLVERCRCERIQKKESLKNKVTNMKETKPTTDN